MFVCSHINACRPTTHAHKLSCIDSGSLFCATGMTDQRDLPLSTHEQLYRNKELNVQIIKFSPSVFLPYFTHAVIAVFFSPPFLRLLYSSHPCICNQSCPACSIKAHLSVRLHLPPLCCVPRLDVKM